MNKFLLSIGILLYCSTSCAQFGWVMQQSGSKTNLRSITTKDGINAITVGEHGVVLTTDNPWLGVWHVQQSPTKINLNGVTAISPLMAIAVGPKDTIYRTLNKGVSWKGFPSKMRGECYTVDTINTVWAVDFDTITSSLAAVGDAWEILISSDSGRHWFDDVPAISQINVPTRNNCVSAYGGHILVGADASNQMGGYLYPDNFFYSADGGYNWTLNSNALHGTGPAWAPAYYGADYKAWILCGEKGAIYHSKNKGISWDLIPSGTTENLNAVRFANDSLYGYICGNNGTILATVDGGYNWAPQIAPTKANLRCVAVSDPFHAFICGDNGTILWTQDAGYSGVASQSGNVVMNIEAFPNPIAEGTTFDFLLMKSGTIELSIYNLLGEKIAELANGYLESGRHAYFWNAHQYCSGVYFCRLQAEGESMFCRVMIAH